MFVVAARGGSSWRVVNLAASSGIVLDFTSSHSLGTIDVPAGSPSRLGQ